jgi:hypothetical protein
MKGYGWNGSAWWESPMPAAKKPAATKKVTKAEAFENVKELRKKIRLLKECLPGIHSGAELKAAMATTDLYVQNVLKYVPGFDLILQQERSAAANAGPKLSPYLAAMVLEIGELVQKIPTFDKAPEGEAENKLGAIRALMKAKPTLSEVEQEKQLKAIRAIVGLKPPKKPVAKKPVVKETISISFESDVLLPDLKENQSVESGQIIGDPIPWKDIPDGTPITWGGFMVWIPKGQDDTGGGASPYYVHPDWLPHLSAVKKLKTAKTLKGET